MRPSEKITLGIRAIPAGFVFSLLGLSHLQLNETLGTTVAYSGLVAIVSGAALVVTGGLQLRTRTSESFGRDSI